MFNIFLQNRIKLLKYYLNQIKPLTKPLCRYNNKNVVELIHGLKDPLNVWSITIEQPKKPR